MKQKALTIALAGNPNSGKTTIFNAITGTRQKVGNWPGVTIEKKEGAVTWKKHELVIVDLPGTYSLTPFSLEEIVARDYVLDETPDVVIVIIDASNLERSLYLATQIRELDCKVVFALNMADQAQARGIKIDAHKLSQLLDLPVVFTVGNKNRGIDQLLEKAIELAGTQRKPPLRRVRYSLEIEKAIDVLKARLSDELGDQLRYNPRWTAVKLIEDDAIIKQRLQELSESRSGRLIAEAAAQREYLRTRFNDDPEIVTTDERYGFISGIIKEVQTSSTLQRVDRSRAIDLVLTNRYLGIPIFFIFIWAMFQITFTLGAYPQEWIESGMDWLTGVAGRMIPAGLLHDLVVDGILQGIGAVIVFLPNILILFFCIALFEDTGYMARTAFLMDKIMHLVGLHGKSFIPMLMGFGCNVPAIMAARTLESRTDRILTILITPFMSCSAKLPVYIVLAGGFFGARAGSVIFGIYMTGIVISILSGRLLRSTLFRGADAPFVMELPPYRMPILKSLLIHMWDRSKIFVQRMGGVILVGSIVIWAMANYPRNPALETWHATEAAALQTQYSEQLSMAAAAEQAGIETELQAALQALDQQKKAQQASDSLLGIIGRGIAPFFKPLGIEWRGGIALLSGFVAKEIVVSTLGVLHPSSDEQEPQSLTNALRAAGMTSLSALAMMVFVLLYVPCLGTVAAVRRETGSNGWMLFSIAYSTGVAWLMACVIYQGGRLIGFA